MSNERVLQNTATGVEGVVASGKRRLPTNGSSGISGHTSSVCVEQSFCGVAKFTLGLT